jgi:CheY-like chemotaxis protein
MKILIVNDSLALVMGMVECLQQDGLDISGLIPDEGRVYGSRKDPRTCIEEADVIFLDHHMPVMNGDEWLKHWKSQVDFSGKEVVGISNMYGSQRYLLRQIGSEPGAIREHIHEVLAKKERGVVTS